MPVQLEPVPSGTTLYKDPDDVEFKTFNWDRVLPAGVVIQSSTWTVTPSGLSTDNRSIGANGRSTTARLTGGVAGTTYQVRNLIVTNESPPQQWYRSFFVKVKVL